MNKRYLEIVTRLLMRARPTLASTHTLAFKNVFGAVAGYVDGGIFISCGAFGVALRLPPDMLDGLFQEEDVQHLKYFPNGHVKKEYAVLPRRIMENSPRFRELVDESVRYALSSPRRPKA